MPEPLAASHAEALRDVARDPDLWRWTLSRVRTPADLAACIEAALVAQTAGTALPLAIVAGGRVAGTTCLARADLPGHRVEIGWTFVGRPGQRLAVNTEAKRLLLGHALDAPRVEFRTDARNAVSRAAIARLGATEDGTLRRHMTRADGTPRDTVAVSVVAAEWPDVAARRAERLNGCRTHLNRARRRRRPLPHPA